jgi:hypothetical protein
MGDSEGGPADLNFPGQSPDRHRAWRRLPDRGTAGQGDRDERNQKAAGPGDAKTPIEPRRVALHESQELKRQYGVQNVSKVWNEDEVCLVTPPFLATSPHRLLQCAFSVPDSSVFTGIHRENGPLTVPHHPSSFPV